MSDGPGAGRQHLLYILGENVALQIDSVPSFANAHASHLVRMGNNRNRYDSIFDGGNGQADAVDRERAFVDDESIEFGRDRNAQPPVSIAERFAGKKLSRAIDMALHHVPVQTPRRKQRPFKIDQRTRQELAQIRESQCFRCKVGREGSGLEVDRRQTHAIDGNAAALDGIRQYQPRLDAEPRAGSLGLETRDGP